MKKPPIYTSLDNFRLKRREVLPYTDLGENFAEWIEETAMNLLCKRNDAELTAGAELKKRTDTQEQVFFRINGRSYFLDFYLPKYRMAIEIDGGYHKMQRERDRERDRDFNEIGVRTIRINSKAVLEGKFMATLKNKISP